MYFEEYVMRQGIRSFILMFCIIAFSGTLALAGARLAILLRGGEMVTGELLEVKEDALIVSEDMGAFEDILKSHPNKILRVDKTEIKDLTICGKSHVLDGMTVGLATGLCVGALMAYDPKGLNATSSYLDRSGGGPIAMIVFGLGGCALGAFAGGLGTAVMRDRHIDVERRQNFLSLRELAHYKEAKPDSFKEILSTNIN